MLTRKELAELVIEVLNLQRRFFRTRSPVDLDTSRAAERRLRHEAERVADDKDVLPFMREGPH